MDHRIMMELTGETKRAIVKHGHDAIKTKSWNRAGCILAEEAGEVVKEIIQTYDDNGSLKPGVNEKEGLLRIYKEAKQTASVAIRIMERIRNRASEITSLEEASKNVGTVKP